MGSGNALARAPSTATPGASAEQERTSRPNERGSFATSELAGKRAKLRQLCHPVVRTGSRTLKSPVTRSEKKKKRDLRSRGWARGAARGGRRPGWYYTYTRFRARDARGNAPVPPPRVPLVVRSRPRRTGTVQINRNRSAKKRKRFGARTASVGASRRRSDARARRAREQKDRTFRVGRLRPRTFCILSATTFWFALATVSRPSFQSNEHSAVRVPGSRRRVYSHRHLNPVSPTRLLHAKHLPWFSCTGAAGAAAGGPPAGQATRRRRRAVRGGPASASPPRGGRRCCA